MGQYAALARVLALLVAATGLFMSGWYVNGIRHERNALKADADSQSALNEQLAKERERANGYSDQVIALLSAPKPGESIREIVRTVKNDCKLEPSLIDAIGKAASDTNRRIDGEMVQ